MTPLLNPNQPRRQPAGQPGASPDGSGLGVEIGPDRRRPSSRPGPRKSCSDDGLSPSLPERDGIDPVHVGRRSRHGLEQPPGVVMVQSLGSDPDDVGREVADLPVVDVSSAGRTAQGSDHRVVRPRRTSCRRGPATRTDNPRPAAQTQVGGPSSLASRACQPAVGGVTDADAATVAEGPGAGLVHVPASVASRARPRRSAAATTAAGHVVRPRCPRASARVERSRCRRAPAPAAPGGAPSREVDGRARRRRRTRR